MSKKKKTAVKPLPIQETPDMEVYDDVITWGDKDLFKLLYKEFSIEEGWCKTTKAMEITRVGCLIQVSTQQGDSIAEALTFVPNTKIYEIKNEIGQVVERKIIKNINQ